MPLVTHVKARRDAPPGFYPVEAAGLRWLAVPGGADVVEVLDVDERHISVRRLEPVPPTPAAAEQLGRRLAATHAAGAPGWGCPPGDWAGDGFIGPLVLPHAPGGEADFGTFYAEHRLLPYLRAARDARTVDADDVRVVEAAVDRLLTGGAHPSERPARVHGDLWAGNVVWTASGATLIDPAAHGGHRETDLAMLALFGLPHLDRLLAAYDEASPLADGWRDRVPLHQLHPLLVHVVLFGSSYVARALAAAAAVR